MTPLPQNTSTTSHSLIPSGPLIQMVYYDILDAYMYWKMGIYNSVFFSTHTTIPSQDTLAKQRPFTLYICNTTGQDFKPMSRITANHAPLALTQNLCTINLMDFSNHFCVKYKIPFPCCICSSGIFPYYSIYNRSLVGFCWCFTSYIVLANDYVKHLYFYYLPTPVITSIDHIPTLLPNN